MKTFKTKSLVSYKTDEEIASGCFTSSFISFEVVIRLYRQLYDKMELKDQPIGYRVTEQGIDIIMD